MATRRKAHNNREAKRRLDCPSGKLDYCTKPKAVLAASKAGIPLHPYKCPYCRSWHLTKSVEAVFPPRYKEIPYRGHVLVIDDGLWTTPSLPGRAFEKIHEIREALKGVPLPHTSSGPIQGVP